jgi:spermidine synthase
MIISLLAIGLISILGQAVLLRELNVAFYGIELIYLFALGIWLFWTAIGALIGRRIHLPSHIHLALLFIIFGVTLLLDIAFIRSSRLIFGGVPGAYLSFLQQLLITVISLLPAGLLSGLLFQWAAKIYVVDGRTAAAAFAIESAGGVVGGLAATLFLTWGIQNLTIAFACSLVAAIVPIPIMTKHPHPSLPHQEGRIQEWVLFRNQDRFLCRWAATIFAGILLLFLYYVTPIDTLMTAWNHPNLLESRDSPYGRITLTRLHDQIAVFENDALSFETEGTEAEYFCHLAALQHPHPQHVLILGGGIEGTVHEMLQHAPAKIEYVELNPIMLNMVQQHLPETTRKSLSAPNVHITLADPRRFLKESGTYDLILVGMPEPASGQANRFYTREFFEQCALKLNPGGILAFRLRTAENLWTLPMTHRTVSIYRSLEAVFPEVLFLPGTTNIVTASREPLPHKAEIMSRRLSDRIITARLVSPNYIRYLFTNDRFFETKKILKSVAAPPNTDVRPVCYQYAFTSWLSKFFPRIALVDFSSFIEKNVAKPPFSFLLWISLPLAFVLCRFLPALRRIVLIAVAGFLGMVLETILILYYQMKFGILYQDIGLMLMSFMAGLALGALVVKVLMSRMGDKESVARLYGAGLLAGFCLLSMMIATKVAMSASLSLVHTAGFLLTAGFLVAGIFAYTSMHGIQDQKSVISPLYSADLFGGCLGSLVGSLILIPLLGLDAATKSMLILAAFSFLLV